MYTGGAKGHVSATVGASVSGIRAGGTLQPFRRASVSFRGASAACTGMKFSFAQLFKHQRKSNQLKANYYHTRVYVRGTAFGGRTGPENISSSPETPAPRFCTACVCVCVVAQADASRERVAATRSLSNRRPVGKSDPFSVVSQKRQRERENGFACPFQSQCRGTELMIFSNSLAEPAPDAD